MLSAVHLRTIVSVTSTPAQRVLVVDDDETVSDVVRRYLEREGYEVDTAADGPSGLEQALASPPDLMVLDLMLPGLDGVEVCRRIDHRLAKVVMLTARDDPDLEVAATEAGADAFLTKPFSSVELLDLVERLLQPTG